VKNPFISYQLATAVVDYASRFKAVFPHLTDNLLTPEGLGVPEETFYVLQVSTVHSQI
jgi:hypothetical protein